MGTAYRFIDKRYAWVTYALHMGPPFDNKPIHPGEVMLVVGPCDKGSGYYCVLHGGSLRRIEKYIIDGRHNGFEPLHNA